MIFNLIDSVFCCFIEVFELIFESIICIFEVFFELLDNLFGEWGQ